MKDSREQNQSRRPLSPGAPARHKDRSEPEFRGKIYDPEDCDAKLGKESTLMAQGETKTCSAFSRQKLPFIFTWIALCFFRSSRD